MLDRSVMIGMYIDMLLLWWQTIHWIDFSSSWVPGKSLVDETWHTNTLWFQLLIAAREWWQLSIWNKDMSNMIFKKKHYIKSGWASNLVFKFFIDSLWILHHTFQAHSPPCNLSSTICPCSTITIDQWHLLSSLATWDQSLGLTGGRRTWLLRAKSKRRHMYT